MKLDIKSKNIDLTAAIRDFVESKMATLDAKVARFGTAVSAEVEVGKTSQHHKKGPVFRAEVHVRLPNKLVYAEAKNYDLYIAINDAKKEAERQVVAYKGTLEAKRKRGALKAKRGEAGVKGGRKLDESV
jgi:putative sigma-54 modulation protein